MNVTGTNTDKHIFIKNYKLGSLKNGRILSVVKNGLNCLLNWVITCCVY